MIQRSLGAFPLRFKGGGTFSQDIVKFDDAVFDRADVRSFISIAAAKNQELWNVADRAPDGRVICVWASRSCVKLAGREDSLREETHGTV
jgi:hypothetical protein